MMVMVKVKLGKWHEPKSLWLGNPPLIWNTTAAFYERGLWEGKVLSSDVVYFGLRLLHTLC